MEQHTSQRQPGIEANMSPAPAYMPRFAGAGRLFGKTALITGGDSGIGRATAILFAREGANVAIHYKDEHADARKTLNLIEAEGAEGMLMHDDIGLQPEAARVVASVTANLGRINVLVNNAAEQHVQEDIADITEDQLRGTFQTNLFSQFFLVQQVLPQMEAGDSIVNITSVTAFRGQDQLVDYASSKGGILALTRALAKKYAAKGIRVNAVAPGPIWTPLIPASFPPDKVASFGKDAPMGRPGQPCEVAPAILFLACDDSSYMTGQTLHPNGGEAVGS
jgi:NAD(P)-dependent dehydrogenase (short-subunit alcohol dehydrogenase family)